MDKLNLLSLEERESNRNVLSEKERKKLDDELSNICASYKFLNESDIKRVKDLINDGADVGVVCWGFSILYCAADRGHIEIVQILVQAGADPDGPTFTGCSALDCAAFKGYLEIVKILVLQAGAGIGRGIGSTGYTALDYASMGGQTEILKFLRENISTE